MASMENQLLVRQTFLGHWALIDFQSRGPKTDIQPEKRVCAAFHTPLGRDLHERLFWNVSIHEVQCCSRLRCFTAARVASFNSPGLSRQGVPRSCVHGTVRWPSSLPRLAESHLDRSRSLHRVVYPDDHGSPALVTLTPFPASVGDERFCPNSVSSCRCPLSSSRCPL